MSAPLTIPQKSYLSQLARRSFARDCALARGRGETPDTSSLAADKFRHEHVTAASGKNGLRCCSQDDYGAVKAHFLDLLGETGHAMNALVHQQGNARRVAEYKLVQACQDTGLSITYAAKICATQFKCSLDDATAKQLWCLMFTIQNRGRKVTFREEVCA
jgi:hypothetical protein